MEKGNIVSGSFFVFRYIQQNEPQYAFVVPKKIAKTAVKRNYLRRQGYNMLRVLKPNKEVGIFFYKKESVTAKKEEILKDINFILKKAHIL